MTDIPVDYAKSELPCSINNAHSSSGMIGRAPPTRLPDHINDQPLIGTVATPESCVTSLDVFTPLTPVEQHHLASAIVVTRKVKGSMLFEPHQRASVAYVLMNGRVDLFRISSEGRKLVVDTLEPIRLFGELSFDNASEHDLYAETTRACTLYVIPAIDLQDMVRHNPDIGLRVLQVQARSMQQRNSLIEELAFCPVSVRLAGLLLREADEDSLVLGFTHQNIADMLGTYRETVSETLGRMRDDGAITISMRRIQIIDRRQLVRLLSN